jgi:ELWxxDGT repeat protein
MATLGDRVYFAAREREGGPDALWVSDGTISGTTTLATFAATGDFPALLTPVGEHLFFITTAATSETSGLWTSDGSSAGTRFVAPFVPGTVSQMTAAGGRAFLVVGPATDGQNLWVSDGTALGTQALLEQEVPALSQLIGLGDQVFFAVESQLWTSDGSRHGTRLVADFRSGERTPTIEQLTVVGQLLFFALRYSGTQVQLYRSDGSTPGTGPVSDIMFRELASMCAVAARRGNGRRRPRPPGPVSDPRSRDRVPCRPGQLQAAPRPQRTCAGMSHGTRRAPPGAVGHDSPDRSSR